MQNIIFLDIDGVLNDNCAYFLLESVDVLKHLIKLYNAKIVMITSLQGNGTEKRRKRIRDKLKDFNIQNIDFIDPNFEGELYFDGYVKGFKMVPRLLGIINYLQNTGKCNYVILDDDYYFDYKFIKLNCYRPSPFDGLTYEDLPKIKFETVNLNDFKNIKYRYRQLGAYELATNNLVRVLKNIQEKH